MSGLVSTQLACARTQSRSSIGVSPSKVAARSPGRRKLAPARAAGRRPAPWSAPGTAPGPGRPRAARSAPAAGRPATCPTPCRSRPPPSGPRGRASAASAWCGHGCADPRGRRAGPAAARAPTPARRGAPGRAGSVLDVGQRRRHPGGDRRQHAARVQQITASPRPSPLSRLCARSGLTSTARCADSLVTGSTTERGGSTGGALGVPAVRRRLPVLGVSGEVDVYSAPACATA